MDTGACHENSISMNLLAVSTILIDLNLFRSINSRNRDYQYVLVCFSSQEQQQEVFKHCVNAEPHHGEKWATVSKNIENWRLKTGEILPLCAKSLEIPT